jgi:hypothetical protein
LKGSTPPITRLVWPDSCRLAPSRFPAVSIYDGVADPRDLAVAFAVEAITNERIRNELGQLQLVPPEERVSGPGTTPIMAAFTHLNPEGSRFSDGTWGVFYAGESFATALAEVSHHRARFLRKTAEGPIELDFRVYLTRVEAYLHDLRGERETRAELYHPESYAASQVFARRLRAAGSWGIVYESVRRVEGECVALFRPRALSHCREDRHIALVWDGQRMTQFFEKSAPERLDPS